MGPGKAPFPAERVVKSFDSLSTRERACKGSPFSPPSAPGRRLGQSGVNQATLRLGKGGGGCGFPSTTAIGTVWILLASL